VAHLGDVWVRARRALIPDGFVAGVIFILIASPIMALGLLITISTPWGVGPWDVLHLGLAGKTGLTIGRANQLTGLLVILLTLLLGGRTVTLVTLMNVTLVGTWLDLYNSWNVVPYVSGPAGLAYLALGVLVVGFGIALYLHPDLGAGPRDGLMLVLTQRTGQPLYRVKVAMDITAMLTGLALGGPVGIGTIVVALGLGPAIHFFRRVLRALDPRIARRAPEGRAVKLRQVSEGQLSDESQQRRMAP